MAPFRTLASLLFLCLASLAVGDRGVERTVPVRSTVETSVAANALTLVQHPLRAGAGGLEREAPPTGKAGEGSDDPPQRARVVRRGHGVARQAAERSLRRAGDSRHRAHRLPDATAPPA